jgi:hypothetical protein
LGTLGFLRVASNIGANSPSEQWRSLIGEVIAPNSEAAVPTTFVPQSQLFQSEQSLKQSTFANGVWRSKFRGRALVSVTVGQSLQDATVAEICLALAQPVQCILADTSPFNPQLIVANTVNATRSSCYAHGTFAL